MTNRWLGELPADEAAKLLDLMEPDEADDVRRLLTYEEVEVGFLAGEVFMIKIKTINLKL